MKEKRILYPINIVTRTDYAVKFFQILDVNDSLDNAIISRNSNLIYSRESGALNEAFQIGWVLVAIEHSTGTDNWLIGFEDKPYRSMKN